MNTNGLVNFYIVQKNDTVDSICDKFKISKRVFYRYNKIIKYVPLKANIPVYIVSFTETQIIDMNLENDVIAISLSSIAYLIKECLISNIYIEDNVQYNKKSLDQEYTKLLNELSNLSDEQKDEIHEQLKEMSDKLAEMVLLLLDKNKEKIMDIEKQIKDLIEEFTITVAEIKSGVNKELLTTTLTNITSNYQKIALKLILRKYEDVYLIFIDTLNQFETINKNIILH